MTPYSLVCDSFLDKISSDTDFFKYDGLSAEETVEIINKRTLQLMISCLPNLQKEILTEHEISFLNKDDDMEEFNFELNDYEINLLSEKMVYEHYNQKKLKLSVFNKYIGSGTMKVFSPAEERRSYLEFIENIKGHYLSVLEDYNIRVRGVGEFIY